SQRLLGILDTARASGGPPESTDNVQLDGRCAEPPHRALSVALRLDAAGSRAPDRSPWTTPERHNLLDHRGPRAAAPRHGAGFRLRPSGTSGYGYWRLNPLCRGGQDHGAVVSAPRVRHPDRR